jgi:RNA polymerase subunit RPABC4/transcription elongation factor Spt4
MANCKTCKKILHEDADFCPSCRDPDPIEEKKFTVSNFIWLVIAIMFGFLLSSIFNG